MTVTDRFSGSALRFLAVLGALAVAFALLPQTASAQEGPDDPLDACPEDAPPAGFTDRDDIPQVHRLNVDCAAHFDIVSGFGDNTYRPRLQVRRDQMATFIHGTLEAAGVDLPAGTSNTFTDVPDTNVHSDAINSLAEAGIVEGAPQGLGPDQYGPALRTRRDQMASFLMRAAGFALANGDVDAFDSTAQAFTDVPSGNVHFEKVNAAAENNIALGTGGNQFSPRQETRRDQMASFVVRLLNFILDEDGVTPGPAVALALDPAECVVGEPITVTATVTDADDAAVEGADVEFSAQLDDADPETTTAATDADGAATATFTPEDPGNLTFTVTTTVDGEEVTATQTVNCPEPEEPPTENPPLEGQATDAAELTGAEIIEENVDNIVVQYEFDETVQTLPNTASFFRIYTFDGGPLQPPAGNSVLQGFSGSSAQIFDNTVNVTFDQVRGNEANYFTVATVNFGAVTDADGLPNPEGDAPLFGANVSGFTQAPDLVDVEFRPATNQVNFVYDEPVDPASIVPFQHILVDENNNNDGAVAATIHPTRPNVVEATFANITVNTEENTARAVVGTGGVADFDGNANPGDAVDVCCDGQTNAPDLVDVTLDEENFEARWEFTEPVTVNNPNDFFLLHFDSTFDNAINAFVDPANPSVVVAQYNPGEVERAVRAGVNFAAVQAVAGTQPFNSLDVVILDERTFTGGITNAPDLLDAFVQLGNVGGVGTTRVVYDFDQTVDPVVDPNFFFLYDDQGNQFTATNCERSVNDVTQVRCVFAGATQVSDDIISEGVLATVDNDEADPTMSAVRDVNIPERNNPEGAAELQQL